MPRGISFISSAELLLKTAEDDVPDDEYANLLEQVYGVLAALPEFWICQNCENPNKPESSELPDELTWETVCKLIEDCDANPDTVASITGSAPATEFGNNQSRKQYYKRQSTGPKILKNIV